MPTGPPHVLVGLLMLPLGWFLREKVPVKTWASESKTAPGVQRPIECCPNSESYPILTIQMESATLRLFQKLTNIDQRRWNSEALLSPSSASTVPNKTTGDE
jgi:hypothetical protein